MNHLAIYQNPYYQAILDGTKTIESRWYIHNQLPYRKVTERDYIYHKLSGRRLIEYRSPVTMVRYCQGALACYDLLQKFKTEIGIDEEYINGKYKPERQWLSLFTLGPVEQIAKPLSFAQRGQNAWILNFQPQKWELRPRD